MPQPTTDRARHLVIFQGASWLYYCTTMGSRRRLWKWNIPMFLNAILLSYMYFVVALFGEGHTAACLLASLTWWSLYQASLRHPGPIYPWMSSNNSTPTRSTCSHCNGPKPDRCHHCRHCNECIDRFDHHCDWIDNCVGRANYKAFTLFLVYIMLCILHFFWLMYRFFRDTVQGTRRMPTPVRGFLVNVLCLLLYTVIVAPCAVLAAVFIWRTIRNAARNVTTFEDVIRSDHASSNHNQASPYSHGSLRRNLEDAFGPLSPLWMVPTVTSHHALLPGGTAADVV